MSKRNWVCFDCRSAVRREAPTVSPVVCATCSRPLVNLGYKIPIPRKTRVKDWEALREQYLISQREATRARRATQFTRRRELLAEIDKLESLPTNAGRSRAVQLLRKKLKRLTGVAH